MVLPSFAYGRRAHVTRRLFFFFFGLLCVPDYNNSFPFVVAVVILIPLIDFFLLSFHF